MESEPDEPVRNLPAARAPRPLTPAELTERIVSDRTGILGEELYDLATVADTRDPDRRAHFLPLAGLVAAWLAEGYADTTREGYKRDIAFYFRWCIERAINPVQVGWADIRMYQTWLATARPDQRSSAKGRENYTLAARKRYLASVSSFYGFAHAVDEVPTDPTAVLRIRRNRIKVDDPERRVITPAEAARLREVAASYVWANGGVVRRLTMSAIINVALDHGWRQAEFIAANVASLGVKEDLATVAIRMKGDKHKTFILADTSRDAIAALLRHREIDLSIWNPAAPNYGHWPVGGPPTGPLFWFKLNRRMSPQWMSHSLDELVAAAGMNPGHDKNRRTDRITFHTLRRTSGTSKRDAGLPLDVVAEELNHSSLDTTRRHYDMHRARTERSPAVILGTATPLRGPQQ